MPKFIPELFKTSILNCLRVHSFQGLFIYPALLEKLSVDVLCVSVVLIFTKASNHILLTRSKKGKSKSAFLN